MRYGVENSFRTRANLFIKLICCPLHYYFEYQGHQLEFETVNMNIPNFRGVLLLTFMSLKEFTEEFKIETVRQITERGFAARDFAERLGVALNSLHTRRFSSLPFEPCAA